MTWSDPIVEEVRRTREAYAARFHFDLRAIYRDLKEQEKRSGRELVSYMAEGSPASMSSLPIAAPNFDDVPSRSAGPSHKR